MKCRCAKTLVGWQSCFRVRSPWRASDPPRGRPPAESTKVPLKIAALKKLIELQLNGERFPNLLMVIIRFVMPCDDHLIKKLLHIYWEIVPKVRGWWLVVLVGG